MDEARAWLPDELAIIPAGPQLAAALAGVDRSALSDEDLIRLAQARQRLAAHVQAQLLADVHAIGQRTDEIHRADEEARRGWAECEVAMAMTWTGRATGWQLALAEDLLERLPAVFAVLDAGEIDVPRAAVFARETIGLDDDVARRAADQVVGEAGRLTTGQLRVRLRRLVIAADPALASRNAAGQMTQRRVVARLTGAGTAELVGQDLPAHRVAAAMERLTAIARAAKAARDGRKLGQLRGDAMLDLLVGDGVAAGGPVSGAILDHEDAGQAAPPPAVAAKFRRLAADNAQPRDLAEGDDAVDPDHEEVAPLWAAGFDQLPKSRPAAGCTTCGSGRKAALPGPRKGVVDLQVPLTTLMGLTDFPGELAGYGPVIADIVRQVATEQTDTTWRFSVYDPLGRLIHHGTTRRRPKADDVAFIRARDRTCRAPGCRRAARQCDVDHSDDHARSKDSRRCNLACLCPMHHLFKHLKGSRLTQLSYGTLGLTTPLGQYHVTKPETYVDELELALG